LSEDRCRQVDHHDEEKRIKNKKNLNIVIKQGVNLLDNTIKHIIKQGGNLLELISMRILAFI